MEFVAALFSYLL